MTLISRAPIPHARLYLHISHSVTVEHSTSGIGTARACTRANSGTVVFILFLVRPLVKCQNGVISGRLVPLAAGPGREFPHVESAEYQIVHPVSAGSLQLQAAAASRDAHSPSAWQHPPHAHEKHRFSAIALGASGQFYCVCLCNCDRYRACRPLARSTLVIHAIFLGLFFFLADLTSLCIIDNANKQHYMVTLHC